MASFLFRKLFTPRIRFYSSEEDSRPFEEIQREEVLSILASLFQSWQTSWEGTKIALGPLNLSDSALRSLNLYEADQKSTVVSLLANILIAWESSNQPEFAKSVVLLARELRPSLPYVEFDPDENFVLSYSQMAILRFFIKQTGELLKTAVADLSSASLKKFNFSPTTPLSKSRAESLLRERLGLSFFDFLEFPSEPISPPSDTFPALLAASNEFNL